jgi:hypothetical protein
MRLLQAGQTSGNLTALVLTEKDFVATSQVLQKQGVGSQNGVNPGKNKDSEKSFNGISSENNSGVSDASNRNKDKNNDNETKKDGKNDSNSNGQGKSNDNKDKDNDKNNKGNSTNTNANGNNKKDDSTG